MEGYIVSGVVGSIEEQPENSLITIWSSRDNQWHTFRVPRGKARRIKMQDRMRAPARHLFFRPVDKKGNDKAEFPLSNLQWEMAGRNGWIDNNQMILKSRIQSLPGKNISLAILQLRFDKFNPGDRVKLISHWPADYHLLPPGIKGVITASDYEGNYAFRNEDGEFSWIPEQFFKKRIWPF